MENRFFRKYAKLILILFVVTLPIVFLGADAAFKTNSNRVKDWLPKGFEETQELVWFIEQFGGDDLMVVSWDGFTVGESSRESNQTVPGDDPRAEQLAAKLRSAVKTTDEGEVTLFRTVRTASEARDQLADILADAVRNKKNDWYEKRAIDQLEGWIVGPEKPDGTRTGSLVVLFTPEGFDHRHAAVALIREYAQELGIAEEELHIGGPTMDSVAIDEASGSSLDNLTLASGAICLLIALICFRSILVTAFVLLVAVYNQNLSLTLLYATGSTMDSIQLMIPPLVYVLSVSAAVHLVNYYRDAVLEGNIDGAPIGALRRGWAPCFLASTTTSLGLVSLLVSFLLPIQKFGGYAALGVLCGTGIMFLVLPSMLTVFPPRKWCKHLREQPTKRTFKIHWEPVVHLVSRRRYAVAATACVLIAVSVVGVVNIGATARVHDMFARDAKIMKDYRWLESNVGPLVPIEVVVRLPKPATEIGEQEAADSSEDESATYRYPMLDRIAVIRHLQEVILNVEGVESVMSLGKFSPIFQQEFQLGKVAANRVMSARRSDFIDAALLQTAGDLDLWRISARVYAGDRHNYAALMERIKSAVEPELKKAKQQYRFSEVSAVYTGGVPIVMKAQNQLLKDLKNSFVTAFLCIALAMVVLLRSLRAGLVSMIPNVLPAVVVFGIMGLIGVKVEVGSMMTATAAMGIAVDDTLHFLTWFRRGLSDGKSREEAVLFSYERCGTAMIQTTLICGLGLVVFALSPFGPIMRFAILMFSMLLAAIVGDLLVLPALLLSPAGRLFQPRGNSAPIDNPVHVLS